VQRPFAAPGAAGDIDAGQREHHLLDGGFSKLIAKKLFDFQPIPINVFPRRVMEMR
jgi:hypothetical protein